MKLFFEIKLIDEFHRTHGVIRREIMPQAAFIGARPVEELRAGVCHGGMDEVIKMLQAREFRKTLLIEAARLCGHALAEHLEDREGWHGLERQERIEQQRRERGII